MARLYEYVSEVRNLSRHRFKEAHPYPFLVLRLRKEQRRASWTFKTQTISIDAASIGRLAHRENLKIAPEINEYEVFAITKARSNPWPNRISVGRARNNDVVLSDSSVSKLHAHFNVERERENETLLVDAGSHNGTRVNDRKITSGEATGVRIGDSITFGRTRLKMVDSGTLYDLVTQHVEERE